MKVTLRLRLSAHDAHYGGGLVDGARVLGLFGDVATELLIRQDGDEGLFRAYESVEFLAPLHAGDFVEVEGEIVSLGKTSRKMRFEARKYVSPRPDLGDSPRTSSMRRWSSAARWGPVSLRPASSARPERPSRRMVA